VIVLCDRPLEWFVVIVTVAPQKHPALSLPQPNGLSTAMPRQRNANAPTRPHGNSRAYVLARLQREGLTDWIDAIVDGRVSAFAVATHLGWVKRPATLSGENSNQAKRRRWNLARIGG
jgi:hypothetical protein